MKVPSCPSLSGFIPFPFSLAGGASPSLCLRNDNHLFRQTDLTSLLGMKCRPDPSLPPQEKNMNVNTPAPGIEVLALAEWHLLASLGRLRMSQNIVASLGVHKKGWRQSSPIQVRLSVEDRTFFFFFSFSAFFLSALPVRTSQLSECCGHLKKPWGKKQWQTNGKKSEDKIRGRMRLPEKEDTQHHPLLPVACPCLLPSLPLASPFSIFLTYASEIRDCHQGH